MKITKIQTDIRSLMSSAFRMQVPLVPDLPERSQKSLWEEPALLPCLQSNRIVFRISQKHVADPFLQGTHVGHLQ